MVTWQSISTLEMYDFFWPNNIAELITANLQCLAEFSSVIFNSMFILNVSFTQVKMARF